MTIRATILSGISALGVALIALPATGILSPFLVYNPSPSAPIGFYKIEPAGEIRRGDLVFSNLPEDAEDLAAARGYLPKGVPVIKTVFALEGDYVCETGGRLSINENTVVSLRSTDNRGHPLPSPWSSCRPLAHREVLLLSDRIPDSFDGRYFGAVLDTDVLGKAVWIERSWKSSGTGNREARWGGPECKIKAHGANEGLHPCLHIDFYGSRPQDTVLGSDGIPNGDNRSAWFHAPSLACFPPDRPE
jgi:conjugative transfer signal peptidase TraF